MVLGLRGKNRRGSTVHIDYIVHIQDIKPWPPSQSLRSLRSVLIQWENGDRCYGSTNSVVPSLGSIVGEGKIEFNESFKVPVTLSRDMSARAADGDAFQKNFLELNLYESRKDKTVKGQSLATAVIDFAEFGALKENSSVSLPMNCKRSFKNTDRPILYVTLQCVDKARASSSSRESLSRVMSMDSNSNNGGGGGESVSALMNEEYAEEAEIASFSDDDISSHSSVAASSNGRLHNRNRESGSTEGSNGKHAMALKLHFEQENPMHRNPPHENMKRSSSQSSSADLSSDLGSPQSNNALASQSPNSSFGEVVKSIESNAIHSSSAPSAKNEIAEESSDIRMGNEYLAEQVHKDIDDGSSEVMNGAQEFEKLGPPNGVSQENGKSDEKTKEIDEDSLEEDATSDESFDVSKKEEKNNDEEQNIDDTRYPREDELLVAQDANRKQSFGSDTSSGQGNLGISENTLKVERLKHVKSVRADSGRNGLPSNNHHTDIKESSVNHAQKGLASLRLKERKDSKAFPRDTRSAILESKMQQLEHRIKMLEGELTEAAAVEASLYSVVAEHGSSGSKVHAPARRLSRMYLHACKETSLYRRASAAKSAVSGLVLVAKACGNDVPRLTFWLSNSVVLRAIISQAAEKLELPISTGSSYVNRSNKDNAPSPLKWKISSSGKREGIEILNGRSSDWEEPRAFTCALEKIEAWIFSRIVESIWWQTLTPHMQSVDSTEIEKENDSESMKSYNRSFSSTGQDQGNFSLDLWKTAFRDAFDRLCPVRAAGHECGCLPMLARLVMEQSVSRLDVAMFNAILRDSDDEIPTDPVSDPISDSRVLPIPAGTYSFGAGAQLKNAIGNWSRWLTDIFGMDDIESLEEPKDDERQETTFKSFHFLNALSDLMMLPKDMLLNKSIRKEVCPEFDAPLIKRVLDNFVPDEFCPDPIPDEVFEALDSENFDEAEDSATNFPCNAAAIVYSPPSAASVASIIGEFGSQAHLRRSGSSVLRKSYTSDDELDELNSPLALIISDGPRSSPVTMARTGWISKEKNNLNAVRYDLLRDVWMESEI